MPPVSAAGALKNDGSGVFTWEDTITHATEWNNKAMPANADGYLKNDGAGNLVFQAVTLPAMGAPVTKNQGTVYQAATDGFFVGCGVTGTNNTVYRIKTDNQATPTTEVVMCSSGSGDSNTAVGFCVPVKKNDYYVCTQTYGTFTLACKFIPMG